MDERSELMFPKTMFPKKTFPYRVYYADTDAGGVMYYAQYLRMFEQMRALYVEDFGLSLKSLADDDILFACRRAIIDYVSPALLDDTLQVETCITQLKTASMLFEYTAYCPLREKENQPIKIVSAATLMVCCSISGGTVKPRRIPKWVLQRLTETLDA